MWGQGARRDSRQQIAQEETMDDKEVVSAIRATLGDKVGQDRFDLWLGAACRLSLRGEILLVELPNRFSQDWVRSHFRPEIEAACAETLGRPLAVEFRVDEGLARLQAAPRNGQRGQPTTTATAQESLPSDLGAEEATTLLDRSGLSSSSEAAQSLALRDQGLHDPNNGAAATIIESNGPKPGFCRRRFSTLEGFVVGASNRLAHASAQMVAEQPGRLSPLLVYGPTGVGKTHLLEGIWSAARRSRPGIHAVYLSAEQFTTYFVEALRGSGLPSFRRKYRGVELLIIDGLQFFAGKRATLNELLHTTDTLLREGRQLVFAADRAAADLRELSDELVARLSAGMACGIDPPDYPTRLGILRKLAQSRGLAIPDDVAEFVATHLTAHARELSGALNRLEAAARMLHKPITRSLAEEALSEMIRHNARAVRLGDIDKAVCEVLGLEAESLQSDGRGKNVCQPRMVAMWLARKHTRAALAEIGRHFGRRSHSTVVSAQKTVGSWVASQSTLDLSGRRWNVEETIRRIEERLMKA
jgi:chromosomal replication initiator protein